MQSAFFALGLYFLLGYVFLLGLYFLLGYFFLTEIYNHQSNLQLFCNKVVSFLKFFSRRS